MNAEEKTELIALRKEVDQLKQFLYGGMTHEQVVCQSWQDYDKVSAISERPLFSEPRELAIDPPSGERCHSPADHLAMA